ncbi:MAG: L,D-transpeptidase family protein [Pseudolabrys sp.]|nr:L,D-transpeptidase family protein [Pseudolabrys sp.]
MERVRWLPHDLGDRYVFLNQPAYSVSIVDGGKEELSMPVIIGKTSNQTNFFADKIQAIEYNPSWTVPRSIIVNEMVPKAYRDPTYLDRIGYQVTNHRGQPVSSASVAWDRVALNKASVEVRQPPGPRNALGRLKIEFPNRHAIYMHDTPQKSLFKQDKRAFSHGCVRLEQPALMAAALLGKPVGHVSARIAAGKNAVEPVSRQIPVYLAYFTAWPDKDGKIVYFGDVYERDTYLTRAIEKTNAVRTAPR